MGEILKDFALTFNGSIRLEAREERLTAEAGALLLREVDGGDILDVQWQYQA